MIQIKSWETNEVLFEHEGTIIKDAVQEAVKKGISLSFADLKGVDLKDTNLKGANLRSADFRGAYLDGTNFERAHLSRSDFYDATLINVNFKEANLENVNFRYAYLLLANFTNANLKNANLGGVNFKGAILKGANLEDANLFGANFQFAHNIPSGAIPLACPAKGSFIAWKKVRANLIKLEIPSDAKRSSATTSKCRCSKAKVLTITNLFETKTYKEVLNTNYNPLVYKVGEMVYPDSFDENRWNECSHGIHFFMDKKEAILW